MNGGSRQVGEEEFVDDPCAFDANWTLLFASGMRGHDHATQHAIGPHRHRLAVVEAAHDLTFRTLLDLIGGQVQTRLNERMIEDRVLFAACHESEAGEIAEDRPGAILPIEPEQRVCCWELVYREIATNGRERLSQFLRVSTVAPVAKRTEPLETVSETFDGAGAHHLPPDAAGVERRHRPHPTIDQGEGRSSVWGKAAYAGGLTGAIKIKDEPLTARSIDQVPGLPLERSRTAEQIIEKERAESFDGFRCQRREIARKR